MTVPVVSAAMSVMMHRRRAVVVTDRRVMVTRRTVMRRCWRTMGDRSRRVTTMRGRESRSGQGHSSEKNHNCLDDLVHVTPSLSCFEVTQEPSSRLH